VKTVKIIRWLVVVLVVAILGLGAWWTYQHAGLKYYIKAVRYVKALPTKEARDEMWNNFTGNSSERYFAGIYAGDFAGKVWVWGKTGLRPFVTNQDSIYSFYNGCTDQFLHPENHIGDDPPKLARILITDKNQWKKLASVGDLVIITIASEGTAGVLKEIYDYNYWPFIQKDIQTECAK
jgi:hypothetical protein